VSSDPSLPSDGARLVARSLARTIQRHLGVEALRVWLYVGGREHLLHASGARPLTHAVPLTSRARFVGRLELPDLDARSTALLDRVVPWVAHVVDALILADAGMRGLDHTLDERTHADLARERLGWKLTAAQGAVFDRLVLGDPDADIAAALGCRVEAVRIHVARIVRSVGARSRHEVAEWFWEAQGDASPWRAQTEAVLSVSGSNRADD